MTDQEIADLQSRLTEAQATIERAQEWRAMSEHEYEQLERHANELELSNSRQGAEILRLQERNKRLVATCKRAAELYDHLAMSPLEAAAKYGPDYEPPSDAEWLEMRQMLADAVACENP